MSSERKRLAPLAALAAIFAAAAALRLWRLDAQVLYIDEYFEAYAAWKPRTLGELLAILRDNPLHVLLGPLSNFLWGRWLLVPEALRTPNAWLGAATIVPVFFLGRRLSGVRTGLIAAFLLAFSLLHAEWSRRLPFYPPMVLLGVLSVLTLLRGLEGEGLAPFLPYAALQVAFLYTHPYAFIALALEWAWVGLAHRADLRRFSRCAAGALLAYAPWHVFASRQLLAKRYFYFNELYGWHPLRDCVRALVVWGQAPEGTQRMFTPWTRTASLAAACLYAALAAAGLVRIARRGWTASWALAAAWVFGGLAAIVALDGAFSYNFFPRQALFALPFYLLLTAEGAGALLDRFEGGARRAVGAGLALAWLVVSVPAHLADRNALVSLRELRRSVLRRVLKGTGPEEVLLFMAPNNAQMFLMDFDRTAFLRADYPRMSGGFYQFRLPDELTATHDGQARRVFSIVRPGASLDDERARWRALVGGPASKVRLTYADLAEPLPGDERKLSEFSTFVAGLAPKP